jgi:hypothetical protein
MQGMRLRLAPGKKALAFRARATRQNLTQSRKLEPQRLQKLTLEIWQLLTPNF